MQPVLEGNDYVLERQLKPEARADIIRLMAEEKIAPTSMIDVSDGLSSDLLHLCTDSEVGCSLYEEKIPIDHTTFNTALEFKMDPTMCALSGGEDYELLITGHESLIKYISDSTEIDLHLIGDIEIGSGNVTAVNNAGVNVTLDTGGWDHFTET